jgi:O-antigen/teichoic acid export membrane protein
MSRAAVILRNVASNWAGFALNAGITLILTPFILSELGATRYGIWVLTSSVIGYYGLLDLGFRAGVTQYLTRYLSAGDLRKASECISSAVVVLGSLGAIMLVLSVLGATLAPHLFTLPEGTDREAFWCILIVGCSTGVQFALQPYTSIFTATQRFDLASAIGVVTRLLTATSIVISLQSGWGLVGMSAATCLTSVVDYVVRWYVARRLAPGLEVALRHSSWTRVREIGAFGAWNFLASINGFVYQHVPNLLIGTLMPIAAVGHYALATGLIRHISSMLGPIPQVLYPAATQLHVRGELRSLERLYHDGSRLMLLMMVSIVLVGGFWAYDFYRLWIGEKYLSASAFMSVAQLFQILLVSVFTTYSSAIANQVLVGAGHVRTVATVLICGSILNCGLSVLLIGRYGLAGVALATVIASVACDLIVMPLLLQHQVGLSAARFARHVWGRPAAVAALQACLFISIRAIGGSPDNWFQLASEGMAAGVGALAIILAIGITSEERARFVIVPARRLMRTEWRSAGAA